jgi:hypothetical protein
MRLRTEGELLESLLPATLRALHSASQPMEPAAAAAVGSQIVYSGRWLRLSSFSPLLPATLRAGRVPRSPWSLQQQQQQQQKQ